MLPSGDASRVDVLPDTLGLIVLRTLSTMGSQHASGLAARIEQAADRSIRLNQGYAITRAGMRGLAEQTASWRPSADLVNRLLTNEAQ